MATLPPWRRRNLKAADEEDGGKRPRKESGKKAPKSKPAAEEEEEDHLWKRERRRLNQGLKWDSRKKAWRKRGERMSSEEGEEDSEEFEKYEEEMDQWLNAQEARAAMSREKVERALRNRASLHWSEHWSDEYETMFFFHDQSGETVWAVDWYQSEERRAAESSSSVAGGTTNRRITTHTSGVETERRSYPKVLLQPKKTPRPMWVKVADEAADMMSDVETDTMTMTIDVEPVLEPRQSPNREVGKLYHRTISGQKICYAYNSRNCLKGSCKFAHSCQQCQADHPMYDPSCPFNVEDKGTGTKRKHEGKQGTGRSKER